LIKKLLNKLFYNPYKIVKKNKSIQIDESTILLSNCRFQFPDTSGVNSIIIGRNSIIGCAFIFESNEGEIKVGDNSFINGGTSLISRSSIIIGDYVTIAWGCTIYDHNSHSLDYIERQNDIEQQLRDFKAGKSFIESKNWQSVKARPIKIEDNAWIGFDSVILSGVTIGEGSIVGARSVVRNDVEPWTIVAGNPAVVIKRLR